MRKVFTGIMIAACFIQVKAQEKSLKGREYFEHEAKGSLAGKITDAATGKPLAGASIYFADLKVGGMADGEGNYRLPYVPAGSFIAEISYLGYSSLAETVVINGDSKKDFSLSGTAAEQNNVTVTGVSKATSIKRTPIPVTIVSKTYLNRAVASNLMEAISHQPGVSTVTTGPAISKPVIRGLGYNRIITINDGIRQEGQQWGDEHGIEVDEYSAQKVEILRGPASLMYGSDALAGVINILTNVPVAEGTIKASLSGSLNNNNDQHGAYASLAGNVNGFNWNAYSSYKKAGDYSNAYDRTVLNSRFREANFGGYFGVNRSWGYSRFLFSKFDQKPGLVEGERDADGKFILYSGTPYETTASDVILKSKDLLIPFQHIQHTKFALDNSFNLGSGRLTAIVGYQQNQRQEFGDITALNTPGLWFDLKTINYNIAYHLKEKDGYKTSVGVTGMHQSNRNKGIEFLIPEYGLTDIGGYVYTQKQINNKLSASGGIRFDTRNIDSKQLIEGATTKFSAFKKSFSNVSGSAGISYDILKDVTLKANAARGFRAPGIPELAVNGKHEGTNRYEIGNNDLKSETTLQFDGGVEINSSHFNLTVNGFYNNIQNYIFYGKLLSFNGSDSLSNGTTTYKFNQQTAALAGFEISFDLHPHPYDWLHFENTLSVVRGKFNKDIDGSKNLPLISPARFLSELRAEFPKQLENMPNFYVKLEMENVASQNNPFTGFGTETRTDGYTLFNIGLGTDLSFEGHKLCSFSIALNNVGDVAYQNHLSRLKYAAENVVTGRTGVFNMGRNFTARLILPFDWKVKKS
ncbi:MAG: TonB-dependent receptor [Chitinophagaceae bacterium]